MNPTGNPSTPTGAAQPTQFPFLVVACIGLIVLGVSPIAFSADPAPTFQFFCESPGLQYAGRVFLLAVTGGLVLLVARLDPDEGTGKIIRLCGFALLAALLTDLHFHTRDIYNLEWQVEQYNGILRHRYPAPDQYRFLPQGTLWWMLLSNGDFVFSYVVYRFLFTFLACQSFYTFARLYLIRRDAVIVVLLYAAFYPLSTRYYNGNLLDPMSHAVMLAILTCCHRGQFARVFWLFVLGVFIKETTLLLAPCYFLANLESLRTRDYRIGLRVALLGLAGLIVFLACRIPFAFNFDFRTLNRTNGWMIASNLGLASGGAVSTVSVFQRYLHPLVFIFMWLPVVVMGRKRLPRSLFWTTIYLAAGIYGSNLCFGWNYESRNFVPVLILMLVCSLVIANSLSAEDRGKEAPDDKTGPPSAGRTLPQIGS
jgi:hypothetical protein